MTYAAKPAERYIVLAEDNHDLRNALARLLELEGFRVLPAANGSEALALFNARGGKVDLIITDIEMPRVNGFELIAAVSSRSPHVPILVFTGSRGGKLPDDARIHVLAKPCYPDVLLARVTLILQSA